MWPRGERVVHKNPFRSELIHESKTSEIEVRSYPRILVKLNFIKINGVSPIFQAERSDREVITHDEALECAALSVEVEIRSIDDTCVNTSIFTVATPSSITLIMGAIVKRRRRA